MSRVAESGETGRDQDAAFVRNAFAKIADRYVLTNHVLSVGTDILWRKKVGRMVAGWEPKRILDVATGTGDLALEMQKVCPEAEVIGSDFCEEMLVHAKRRGVRETLVADGLNLPFGNGSFDVATVAFGLRNMASWDEGLAELHRVVRPGGQVLVLDFSLPRGVMRRPYAFYLNKVLPKVAGVLTGEGEAYEYLAGSIERFPSGEAMLERFARAGFAERKWIPLSGGIASIYTGLVEG
ncbi:MAG: ubiquinone/menaquinone biosynthesis methyltransferase [Verrucomicrobia bacterium]|nr:ubiquinone/menaquinone biosynthesis methyltransferase [Verrucomicrobiota bacterium]